MSLAVFDDVSLHFGKKTIVDELDLRLGNDDRIGLIGPNGSGKTSLLRMLAGEQAPDGGRVHLRGGLRLGYLPQDIELSGNKPLLEHVVSSVQGRDGLEASVREAEAELTRAQEQAAEASDEARAALDERMMEIAEQLSDLHERTAHY